MKGAEKERLKYERRKEKKKEKDGEEEGFANEDEPDLLEKLIEEADTKKVNHSLPFTQLQTSSPGCSL